MAKKINVDMGLQALEVAPIASSNLSFSAELFLKFLFYLEQNNTSREHKLFKIFALLSKDLQNEINGLFDERKLSIKDKLPIIKLRFNTDVGDSRNQEDKYDIENLTIEELLKIHSDGFVKWRYAYEFENKYYYLDFNFNLMKIFIECLMNIIEKKRL